VPRPGSAVELIAALSLPAGATVRYTEKIHHPALPRPETTNGTMRVDANGDLVREQSWPERMSFEIGEDFLTERRGADGEPNLVPIPSEMKPFLRAIRDLFGGDVDALRRAFSLEMVESDGRYRVRLSGKPPASDIALILTVCGPRLLAIEITRSDGLRRVLSFEPPR